MGEHCFPIMYPVYEDYFTDRQQDAMLELGPNSAAAVLHSYSQGVNQPSLMQKIRGNLAEIWTLHDNFLPTSYALHIFATWAD